MSAPLALDEAKRLAASAACEILATASEAIFDTLTTAFARLLDVARVRVSFASVNRDWFKSRYGLELAEAPCESASCRDALASGHALFVRDATKDPRFADHPSVVGEPHVRFCAAWPLRTPDGHLLGMVCATDPRPRTPTDSDTELLAQCAQQVMEQLELRRALRVLALDHRRLVDYQRFFDLSLELLATVNDRLFFELLSPSWTKVLGWTLQELRAVPCMEFVHPEDLERTMHEAARLLQEKGTTARFENRYRHKDGSWVDFSWTSVVVDGVFYGAARDIRAYKAKERQLVDRDVQQRALLEGMAEGVVLQTASGEIATCNPAAEHILGLTQDQLTGRTSVDARWRSVRADGSPFPGEEHPAMVALTSGRPLRDVVMGVHKPNGELTWISVNAQPLIRSSQDAPHAVITTFRDITQQRAAEENARRVAQQQRLITTGTLAAGIGHEINNPLTYLLGNVEFALERLRSGGGGAVNSEVIRVLVEAQEGGERVRKIVQGLRALAREASEPVPTRVAACAELSASIAMHELRHKARLSLEIDPAAWVLADESRLSQVLVNLLVNAAQAFESADPSVNYVRLRARESTGNRVLIEVQDNGPGMEDYVRMRAFDPFFTTKPVGQGMGLGLSISHNIISSLGGELSVRSAPGRGTTFSISLPSARTSHGQSPDASREKRGRVMVIDDEAPILTLFTRMLEGAHDVVAVQDPRVAVERIVDGERFDVIYCDLMMPHLSGLRVLELVREREPALAEHLVFITGGVMSESERAQLNALPNEKLEKPIGLRVLRDLTARLVESRLSDTRH